MAAPATAHPRAPVDGDGVDGLGEWELALSWKDRLHPISNLPPAPAHLQLAAARELQRRMDAQAAAKKRRLAKQKTKSSAKASAGISKEKRIAVAESERTACGW